VAEHKKVVPAAVAEFHNQEAHREVAAFRKQGAHMQMGELKGPVDRRIVAGNKAQVGPQVREALPIRAVLSARMLGSLRVEIRA
jgi:hypothetical protein